MSYYNIKSTIDSAANITRQITETEQARSACYAELNKLDAMLELLYCKQEYITKELRKLQDKIDEAGL